MQQRRAVCPFKRAEYSNACAEISCLLPDLAKGLPPLLACAMRLAIVHYPFAFNGLCRFPTAFDLRSLYSPGAL
jgi:hypothetical protein